MSDPDATADGEAAAIPTPTTPPPARRGRAAGAAAPVAPARRAGGAGPSCSRCSWSLIVLVAAIVAARISVNYYVITPGDATPVAQYIEVPPRRSTIR